jgi:hypothetical protein
LNGEKERDVPEVRLHQEPRPAARQAFLIFKLFYFTMKVCKIKALLLLSISARKRFKFSFFSERCQLFSSKALIVNPT